MLSIIQILLLVGGVVVTIFATVALRRIPAGHPITGA